MKAWEVTRTSSGERWVVAGRSRKAVSIALARSGVEYAGYENYRAAWEDMRIVRAPNWDALAATEQRNGTTIAEDGTC